MYSEIKHATQKQLAAHIIEEYPSARTVSHIVKLTVAIAMGASDSLLDLCNEWGVEPKYSVSGKDFLLVETTRRRLARAALARDGFIDE